MKEFAVFWGCTIPARFPFIEKATRVMFDDLGARIHELEGHTCCPEGTLVKANDPDAFYTAAARNLALIEREGLDLVTPCNGCYSTFKECESHLKTHWREKDVINERLAKEGLHYDDSVNVVHFAEWLADSMGSALIAEAERLSPGGLDLDVNTDNARAIRFYEDQGLLSPTREGAGGRNRVYTPRDRTRLKLTLRGKRLGLALSREGKHVALSSTCERPARLPVGMPASVLDE